MATDKDGYDWCLAPAAQLQEWLTDHRMTPRMLAEHALPPRVAASTEDLQRLIEHRAEQIRGVLARGELTGPHANMLARGTGIPASMWLALEHNYRAGLAAGLKDVTPQEET